MPSESLPLASMMGPTLLFCIAVVALVISDFKDFRPGRYLFKPLAAGAFIWLALALGALHSTYGLWMLAGLVFCLLGDVFLMPDSERSFLAGLVSFLCGHLLYAIAFISLANNITGLLLSAVPALLLMGLVLRWLLPHVDAAMKVPVAVYTLVITAMLLCAGLTAGHPAAAWILAGAWGFALSDIAVARQQFVKPEKLNPLWGTPLYFAAQMMLATSLLYAG